MEQFINYLAALNPIWIYCIAGGIAYIENVFPPMPSDVILVAAGSLAGLGRVDFILLLVLSTIGSTAGFLTMYKVVIGLVFVFWKRSDSNTFRLRIFIKLNHGLRSMDTGLS